MPHDKHINAAAVSGKMGGNDPGAHDLMREGEKSGYR
jgi:hypothetical protein